MAAWANIMLFLLLVIGSTPHSLIIDVVPGTDRLLNQDCFNQTHCSVSVNDLLENALLFFRSNNTVLFQSDRYEINRARGNILIRNIINLNISGAIQGNDTKVSIVCREQFGLTFVNVVNLTMNNIHFTRCDSELSIESREAINEYISSCNRGTHIQLPPCDMPLTITRSTISVISSTEVSFRNIEIEQTIAIALIAINIHTKLTLDGISLSNNTINCLIASAAPPVSISRYTQLESYEIRNSLFKCGNITENERQLSSGLNILWRHLYYRRVQLTMTNITTENNICEKGNVLIEINVCDETQTYFIIQHLKSSYSNTTQYVHRRGISIIGASYSMCSRYSALLSESYFTLEDIVLDNSILTVAVQNEFQYKSHIEVHLKRFYIYRIKEKQSMSVSHANVTLTDFQLVDSSYINIIDSTLRINGQSSFNNNLGVLRLINTTLYINGNTTLRNNIAAGKSPVVGLITSTVVFQGKTLIQENKAEFSSCLTATYGSTLKVSGSVIFKRNRGYNGGAISLYLGSHIIFEQTSSTMDTSLRFIENNARSYGGAVYIEDYQTAIRTPYGYSTVIPCWLRLKLSKDHEDIKLIYKDNKAEIAGDLVFGGWLGYCYLPPEYNRVSINVKKIFIARNSTELSFLSSTPTRICMCQDSVPNCNITITSIKIPPGKTFTIEAVAVGQGFGVVPSLVGAQVSPGAYIKDNELYQTVGKTCTKLTYTISFESLHTIESLSLNIERHSLVKELEKNKPNDVLFENLLIVLDSIPCAKGYIFNNLTKICECNEVLEENGLECDIQTGTVRRSKEWVNATSLHTHNPLQLGVIVHKYCPFDYCNQTILFVDLEYPDTQCQYNRSGTLCGKCGQNFSAKFGSSSCVRCTNTWVLLIVPTVLIAGICLVLLLTVLNLTISSGTINGLIFYANVIRANQFIFFSDGSSNTFLSWFIAWLNLDIGFEVCFYNGLDTYIKTWLQFVFPMYVWLLVLVIIVSSHYSTTAARLTGNNAVQVLATLFLLSYTKLLRITIVSLSFTTLKYPDGFVQKVWLYDGNVDYLQGKHIALFIAALAVLLFLSIPYTMILVTIQWLQRYTHYVLLKWVSKFIPLFEAYTGPYKIKHRYWPGFLLLVRILLFLVFSLNVVGDPAINLLAVTVTMICILTYSAYLGGVYKSWQLDTLEYSFYVNLGILSSATLYNINSGRNQPQLVFTSTGLAFITFTVIVSYHAYLRLSKTMRGKKLITWITLKIKSSRQQEEDTDNDIIEPQTMSVAVPTLSVVDLQEPLLDD